MTLKELLEKNAAIKAKKDAAAQQKILEEAEIKVVKTEKISGEGEKESAEGNKGSRKGRKPRQRAYLVVDEAVNGPESKEEESKDEDA